jgi:PilZ domain-containing protein
MTHNRTGQYFFRRPLRAVIHLVTDFQSLSMLKPTKGDGYTMNLSMKGCCIDSDVPVEMGMRLSLCMELSDQTTSPLLIPVAQVRWVDASTFGLEFIKMAEPDLGRLQQFVWKHV